MELVQKSVFISYRRTNFPWALAVWQNLKQHGFDVFIDYQGIASGDFETVILENIPARAHFIIILTPSALERCGEPGDLMRREIEEALESKRNIVSLMLEGFSFGTPSIASQLIGTLAPVKKYNALSVPNEYFDEAMEKLRTRFLNVPLSAVIHPPSQVAQQAATAQNAAAEAAPAVRETELTSQQYFERGNESTNPDESIRFYNEAIRLNPEFPAAFYNRGIDRRAKGDLDGAVEDYGSAIRLRPKYAEAYTNRGLARFDKGDLDGALEDYGEAIRLKPDIATAFNNRGNTRQAKGDLDGALKDYEEAIRLKTDYPAAFYGRGIVLLAKGDLDGALEGFEEAIRLKPDFANPFYGRAVVFRAKKMSAAAIADFQQYLRLRGVEQDAWTEKAEGCLRELQAKL